MPYMTPSPRALADHLGDRKIKSGSSPKRELDMRVSKTEFLFGFSTSFRPKDNVMLQSFSIRKLLEIYSREDVTCCGTVTLLPSYLASLFVI